MICLALLDVELQLQVIPFCIIKSPLIYLKVEGWKSNVFRHKFQMSLLVTECHKSP